MSKIDAEELFRKYRDGECSEEELAMLEEWYNQHSPKNIQNLTDTEWAESVLSILQNLDETVLPKQRPLWPRIAVAAALLLFALAGIYFLNNRKPASQVAVLPKNEVLPGKNRALLTLSNGKTIDLTAAHNGTIASDANSTITKEKNGTVNYTITNMQAKAPVYNTITTPRGGQWSLVLPDGTKVMLDAASSITFPVAFTQNERRVSITGQAYFEVVHNQEKPFSVSVKNQLIEDLGTQFNIKAYDDEPEIKTTLVEGKVSVATKTQRLILKPGEQAAGEPNSLFLKLKDDVDLQQVVAWKEGKFRFHQTSLHELMNELGRWYNIDVIYQGDVKNETYYGQLKRNLTLDQTLNILQLSDIHFKIGPKTGNNAGTLTITP